MKIKLLVIFVMLIVCANIVSAQTTEFTYQGKITDTAGTAASYDFEFRLFSVETGGAALATNQRPGVPVSNGVFIARLDFGANFDGQPRWLEIAVKPIGSPNPFTILTPRQSTTSAPYSIKSLNAATADALSVSCVGCVSDANINSISGGKVSGLIPVASVPAGSGSYIQNQATQQTASNFNIAGDGTAGGTLSGNAVNSATQYNIGGSRILTTSNFTSNLFAGVGAGASNGAFGSHNSFFGANAGQLNVSGANNSFFGRNAGNVNTAGNNSFFGAFSGDSNTTGTSNSFFGFNTGAANTTGNASSFFGDEAGKVNTAGGNSFFGANAGRANTTGLFNSFFGYNAGSLTTTGQYNSFFGYGAGAVNTGEYNTFFGSLAGVSNTTANANTFVGDEAGEDNTTGGRNSFFGRWSGNSNTTGADNTFVGFNAALLNTSGTGNTFVGLFAGSFNTDGNDNTVIGSNANVPNGSSLSHATAIGADAVVSTSNTVQLGRTNGFDTVRVSGLIVVGGLGTAGATDICRNASNQLSTCSSSLRYKSDVQSFTGGLDVVRRLRPITFKWKDGGMNDVGFAAEEVSEIEPLLTTTNDKGEIEGVKYAQITTVLVNAVNEQQAQIEKQNAQIEAQQKQLQQQQFVIDGLRKLVCQTNAQAAVCKEKM